MYGSQLSAGETHEHNKLVPGVSDSKKRDVAMSHTDFSPKPTPPASSEMMLQKKMMSFNTMTLPTSKKMKKSKPSENDTSG